MISYTFRFSNSYIIVGYRHLKPRPFLKTRRLAFFTTSFVIGFSAGWTLQAYKKRAFADIDVSPRSTFPYFTAEYDIAYWLKYFYKHDQEHELLSYAFYHLQKHHGLSSPEDKDKWTGFLSQYFEVNPSIAKDVAIELLELLDDDNRDIVYIALFSQKKTPMNEFTKSIIENDEAHKDTLQAYMAKGRDLKSLNHIDFENVMTKGNAMEGAFMASGDTELLFQFIVKVSRLWNMDTLLKDADLKNFYCGVLLKNKLDVICSQHDKARELLRNLSQESKDEVLREFCKSCEESLLQAEKDASNTSNEREMCK